MKRSNNRSFLGSTCVAPVPCLTSNYDMTSCYLPDPAGALIYEVSSQDALGYLVHTDIYILINLITK